MTQTTDYVRPTLKNYQQSKFWCADTIPFLAISRKLGRERHPHMHCEYFCEPKKNSNCTDFLYDMDINSGEDRTFDTRLGYQIEYKAIATTVGAFQCDFEDNEHLPTRGSFDEYKIRMEPIAMRIFVRDKMRDLLQISLENVAGTYSNARQAMFRSASQVTAKSWPQTARKEGLSSLVKGWEHHTNSAGEAIIAPDGVTFNMKKPLQAIAAVWYMFTHALK